MSTPLSIGLLAKNVVTPPITAPPSAPIGQPNAKPIEVNVPTLPVLIKPLAVVFATPRAVDSAYFPLTSVFRQYGQVIVKLLSRLGSTGSGLKRIFYVRNPRVAVLQGVDLRHIKAHRAVHPVGTEV